MSLSKDRPLLRAPAVELAGRGVDRAVPDGDRRCGVVQRHAVSGKWVVLAGFLVLVYMMFGWFGKVIHESEGGSYNAAGGRLVPLGDGLVHLLRGDVLRGVLRRAVLRARALRAVARRPRAEAAVARLLGAVADRRARTPPIRSTPMGAWGIPAFNTLLLLTLGGHRHVGALGAEGGQPRPAHPRSRPHDRARLHVPRLPGVRVHPRLQRAQPQAHVRDLRLDVLHAHRLPRLPRDGRRDHADGDPRSAASPATSSPTTTSRSRACPGTGTSWTWCGCSCSCWSTGSDGRASANATTRRRRAPREGCIGDAAPVAGCGDFFGVWTASALRTLARPV